MKVASALSCAGTGVAREGEVGGIDAGAVRTGAGEDGADQVEGGARLGDAGGQAQIGRRLLEAELHVGVEVAGLRSLRAS